MKELFLNVSMANIKKYYPEYDEVKLAELKYGLEGIYLSITKFIVITSLSIILGIFFEMIIMLIVFNITAPNVTYDAQVKSNVTKIELGNLMKALSDNLQVWFENNEKDIKLIADKALAARRAREAAKKARDAARNTELKGKSKLLNLPTKLVDSWSKDREKCELLVAEGK